MKRYLLIASILTLVFQARAEESESINQSDNKGKFFFNLEGGLPIFPSSRVKLNKAENIEINSTLFVKGSRMISGSIGYFISPEFAIALSVDYAPSYKLEIQAKDTNLANGQKRINRRTPIKHNIWFGMLNLYYQPYVDSKISPYFTVGSGIAHIDTKEASFSFTNVSGQIKQPYFADLLKNNKLLKPKQTIFAWQIGVGTLIDISEKLKFNVGIKFKMMPNYRIITKEPNQEIELEQYIGAVTSTLGIRYQF